MFAGLILLAGTALPPGCEPSQPTAAESEALFAAAAELVPEDLADIEFASTELSKCTFPRVQPETRRGVRSIQQVDLKAFYPDDSDEADAVIQRSISCTISSIFFDGVLSNKTSNCSLATRVLLTYPSITEPVLVEETISLLEAREILGLLEARVGETIGNETFSADQFAEIAELSTIGVSDRRIYYAYYETGCNKSSSIELSGREGEPLESFVLSRKTAMC